MSYKDLKPSDFNEQDTTGDDIRSQLTDINTMLKEIYDESVDHHKISALADDDVENIEPAGKNGIITVIEPNGEQISAAFSIEGGDIITDLGSSANATTGTGAHTGTTGTDGNLTLAVDNANDRIQIENRTGAALDAIVLIKAKTHA